MENRTALSTIEFNQRQDLQKKEKSRYEVERETRLKGALPPLPIEIRYPSFSCRPLLPLSSFCNLWRLRIVAARGSWKSGETGRSEAARKMIFFEIEAEFRRGRDSRSELVDRFLSRYSSIRSLLSSQARLMCDSSSKRRGNVFSNRSRIYIYLSFRGQFLLLLFEYENTVLSRIMEERQELPAFRFQIHSTRVINKIAHRFHNRKETSHRRGEKERKRKKNFLLERNVFFLLADHHRRSFSISRDSPGYK